MDDNPGLNEPTKEPDTEPEFVVPETMAEPGASAPVPALDEDAMIEETVQFINRTVAQMVFGASVIIGEHLLTRNFWRIKTIFIHLDGKPGNSSGYRRLNGWKRWKPGGRHVRI